MARAKTQRPPTATANPTAAKDDGHGRHTEEGDIAKAGDGDSTDTGEVDCVSVRYVCFWNLTRV
jgi:hypothetical protein